MNQAGWGWVLLVWLLGCPVVYGGGLHSCTDQTGRSVLRNEPCQAGERDDRPGPMVETIPLLDRGVRGQYWIPVLINGQVSIDFLIDTGANIVVIPQDVIDKLTALGSVTPTDWMGETIARMADGSLVRHGVVRVDGLHIGQQVVRNVAVSVTPIGSMPLLGTPVLEQLGGWRIDHQPGQRMLVLQSQPAAWQQSDTGSNHPARFRGELGKVMRQCWRQDGSTYPSLQPCPPGGEVAPEATRAQAQVAQCRSILAWVQAYLARSGRDGHSDQLQARVSHYNKHCPGLIYQGDSGQRAILQELVFAPRPGG